MQLTDYVRILWNNKWVIFISTLLLTAAAVAGIQFVPGTYMATSTLRITVVGPGSSDYALFLYTDRVINTYAELADSSLIEAELRDRLGTDEELKITTEAVPDTDLIQLSVRAQDPELARDAANALADILANQRIVREARVEIADRASSPTILSDAVYIALGCLTGLAIGVVLAFLFESTNPRLYNLEQIRALSTLPIVGQIPTLPRGKSPLDMQQNPFIEIEAFHRIQVRLRNRVGGDTLHSLLVISPGPDEGKSTIAAYLTASIGLTGHSVLLVDTDQRAPTVHRLFQKSNDIGLTNVLTGEVSLAEAIQPTEIDNLHVLTSGPPTPHTITLLESAKMKALTRQLQNQYSIVVFDSPALLALVDASVLMGFVDGVLVVARSGGTRKAAFEAVLEEIEQTEPPFAGIVVNRAQRSQAYFDYYSSSYAVKRKRPLFKRLFAPHQKKSADGSPAEGEIPADQDGYRYAENALEETKELTDLSAKPS